MWKKKKENGKLNWKSKMGIIVRIKKEKIPIKDQHSKIEKWRKSIRSVEIKRKKNKEAKRERERKQNVKRSKMWKEAK